MPSGLSCRGQKLRLAANHRTHRAFLEETRPTLPPTLQVELFEVAADQLRARINVLLFNGLGGMVLVLCILFLFLNGRIAFWVAAGIPASIMATFGLMWAMGLSINVSLSRLS